MSQFIPISLIGSNAKAFLQGQLTCDMEQLADGQVTLAAYCNRKGRVLTTLFVYLHNSSYYLLIPADNLEHSLKTFNTYAPFSRVSLETSDIAIPTEQIQTKYQLNPELDLYDACIEQGIAMINEGTCEKYTPQMLNYDQHADAISFNKGCYIGQEIVARTHYLGKTKKHLVKLSNEQLTESDEIVNQQQNTALVIKK